MWLNLHDFDDMTDDKGVTSAFLLTNLAILLNANAMAWQFFFDKLFARKVLNDSELRINWSIETEKNVHLPVGSPLSFLLFNSGSFV
jgi:hypothetical protein